MYDNISYLSTGGLGDSRVSRLASVVSHVVYVVGYENVLVKIIILHRISLVIGGH